MKWLEKVKEQPSLHSENQWNVKDAQLEKRARHYRSRLLKEVDLETITTLPPNEMRQTIERLVYRMIEEERAIIPKQEMEALVKQIINESVGFGPLEALLKEASITEIMVNGPKEIYIENN